MRKVSVFLLALCMGLPLAACHHDDDGGENKVISSKGGSAPVETPADPNRPHPHMTGAGAAPGGPSATDAK